MTWLFILYLEVPLTLGVYSSWADCHARLERFRAYHAPIEMTLECKPNLEMVR